MNREIKFRAWDLLKNKIIQQVSILGISENFVTGFDRDDMLDSAKWESLEGFSHTFALMQYSGLKDKNGKEVYEGDILLSVNAITEPEIQGFVCKFKNFRWIFDSIMHPDIDFYAITDYAYIQKKYAVVGNIYENPNLLKR
jgi:uncharacterized phage protein (TIGR01671 family)